MCGRACLPACLPRVPACLPRVPCVPVRACLRARVCLGVPACRRAGVPACWRAQACASMRLHGRGHFMRRWSANRLRPGRPKNATPDSVSSDSVSSLEFILTPGRGSTITNLRRMTGATEWRNDRDSALNSFSFEEGCISVSFKVNCFCCDPRSGGPRPQRPECSSSPSWKRGPSGCGSRRTSCWA